MFFPAEPMIVQDWWYTTLLGASSPMCPPLNSAIKTESLVVGAGMAGLSAALRLREAGRKVVLVEKNICGGSSTGRSAGFLTPDSELELSQLIRRYGADGARDLWQVPVKGIELILGAVKRYGISCDLLKQDSLFLGLGRSGVEQVEEEMASRKRLGYDQTAYSAEELRGVIGSQAYSAGVRYSGTYGIDALLYAQGVKKALLEQGVSIYEGTEVKSLNDHTVLTHAGSVTASEIIFCIDKISPALSAYAENVFHAQTFLSISEPLSDQELSRLFPREPFQCWDSTLVYTYFRLTGDRRLLVGGGSALTTFARHAVNSPRVIDSVLAGFKDKFPFLRSLAFIQYWPGLIDTTRDLLPTVVKDERCPWVHWVLGCVGLPWAAFCGDFAARQTLKISGESEDLHYYRYFKPNRPFFVPLWLESPLGKSLVFSLNNAWAKYYQVDVKK